MAKLELVDGLTDNYEFSEESIRQFLDNVFHLPLKKGEEILVWETQAALGMPMTAAEFLFLFEKDGPPRSFHFSCMTNKLVNSPERISRQFCFTVSGVGTRIKPEQIPKGLTPSYKIQTAKGEFEYGFILSEPICNMKQARAFNQCLFVAGLIPAGGNLPHHVSRIPAGVNGSIGKERLTKVSLSPSKFHQYTPDHVLHLLDIGVSWQDILSSPAKVMNEINSGSLGASTWTTEPVKSLSLSGLVDPILEWMIAGNMVIQDLNELVTVKCINANMHQDGSAYATYKPIGRGLNPNIREYRCASSSCSATNTSSFLQWVAANRGPTAVEHDPVPELLRDYVFDLSENAVWALGKKGPPRCFPIASFKNAFPHDIQVIESMGRPKSVKAVNEWLCSPHRVTVLGRRFDPTTPAKISDHEGELLMNMFSMPEWGDGGYDQNHVDRFLDYMGYLIPSLEEREYFLDWLTCKLKNMSFRGSAILMIAERQGIGRNTLADMIATLIGHHNVEHVPFSVLTGDKTVQFNDWLESPLIVTDETMSTGKAEDYASAYEKLKNIIDPRPKPMRIDPKYGKQRVSMVYSSYLMFSNHDNAMFMAEHDRRFYVIQNADKPESAQFFMDHNEWLNTTGEDGMPIWARNVWRYMINRPVKLSAMLSPPKQTDLKRRMLTASETTITKAVNSVCQHFGSNFITLEIIKDILIEADERRLVSGNKRNVKAIEEAAKSLTMRVYKNNSPVKVNGKASPVRSYVRGMGVGESNLMAVSAVSPETNKRIRTEMENALSPEAILETILLVRQDLDDMS